MMRRIPNLKFVSFGAAEARTAVLNATVSTRRSLRRTVTGKPTAFFRC
jgi:hypothetical protein